jgi:hypothetical protein
MKPDDPGKRQRVTYDDFRGMAKDPTLDKYAKISSSAKNRLGREALMFDDIRRKVPALDRTGKTILDVGPGCADLPHLVIGQCERAGHRLLLADSPEMLDQLPDRPFITKIPGHFPDDCRETLATLAGKVDGIIAYSILHYVIPGYDVFDFFDSMLALLAPEGALLVGDIPNVSMARRFFASERGVRFHQANMKTTAPPDVRFNTLEPGSIDDGVVLALMLRARSAGFHAYVVPLPDALPLANRREDLVVVRP